MFFQEIFYFIVCLLFHPGINIFSGLFSFLIISKIDIFQFRRIIGGNNIKFINRSLESTVLSFFYTPHTPLQIVSVIISLQC